MPTIRKRLVDEILTRAYADTELKVLIDAEKTARTFADTALGERIATELKRTLEIEGQLRAELDVEVALHAMSFRYFPSNTSLMIPHIIYALASCVRRDSIDNGYNWISNFVDTENTYGLLTIQPPFTSTTTWRFNVKGRMTSSCGGTIRLHARATQTIDTVTTTQLLLQGTDDDVMSAAEGGGVTRAFHMTCDMRLNGDGDIGRMTVHMSIDIVNNPYGSYAATYAGFVPTFMHNYPINIDIGFMQSTLGLDNTIVKTTQLGEDAIDGIQGAGIGHSISLNALGERVVIGNLYGIAFPRIYQFDGKMWSQLGSDIDEQYLGGYQDVSINATGDRVAIGSPNTGFASIYQLDGAIWTQLGSNIIVPNGGFQLLSVSLNALGDRIAIGAPPDESGTGRTTIYQWGGITDGWIILGSDIAVENVTEGSFVSINALGDRVVIGSNERGTVSSTRSTRIYEWNGTEWLQLGQSIDSSNISVVSINRLGDRIAISGQSYDSVTQTYPENKTRLFRYDITMVLWVPLGSDIIQRPYDARGSIRASSVSLNAVGDRVVIGIQQPTIGHVQIFQWDQKTEEWVLSGSKIKGHPDDGTGNTVSLNAVGDRIAIGSRFYDMIRGRVQIYKQDYCVQTDDTKYVTLDSCIVTQCLF